MADYELTISPATPYVLDLAEGNEDLDAIAAQGTTPYGRPFLNRENSAEARTYLDLDGYPPFVRSTKPTQRRDGSPLAVDDRWWSTVDHAWFYWSGSYWLSSQVHGFSQSVNTSASVSYGAMPQLSPQIYLENVVINGLFNGPQNTTDYWRLTFERMVQGASTLVTVAFIDALTFIQSAGDNQHKLITIPINVHQDLTAINCSGYRFGVYKNSAAGSISGGSIVVRYRIAK